MRPFGIAGLSALLLPLAGCATSGEHHGAHGPGDLAYACADGRIARVTYENGGWFVRARARLVYDGRTIALKASPPAYGLRYVSADDDADPILIWSARGEEAWLAAIGRSADPDAPEREIAHCTRVREGAAAPAHGAGGGEHH